MTKMQSKMPLISYGKTGLVLIAGEHYKYSSDAERRWLQIMEPLLLDGKCKTLVWQPDPFPLTYKYCREECRDTYRADAIVTWADGDDNWDWVIEIKRGALHQKSASKMKRFCQQYEHKDLVLVWFGSLPKKGVAFRRLEKLKPHLHHIWQIKN